MTENDESPKIGLDVTAFFEERLALCLTWCLSAYLHTKLGFTKMQAMRAEKERREMKGKERHMLVTS